MKAMVLAQPGAAARAGRVEPSRRPARASSCCASAPAASAAPTCTSSTASSPTPSCRSSPGTRSSAAPPTAAASACRGSAGPAASAASAGAAARTSASGPASPATTSTAATPSGSSPTSATASRSPTATTLGAGAAPLRGADRLPRAADGGRRASGSGLYGFGAAAHIVAQVARFQGRRVFAVTRAGDEAAQEFARSLGAEWAGSGAPPEELDAAIIFAPAGELVPRGARAPSAAAAASSARASTCRTIPSFPYEILWGERCAPLGREPDPRPTARSSSPWRRACRSHRGRGLPARAGERRARPAARGRRPRRARARPLTPAGARRGERQCDA